MTLSGLNIIEIITLNMPVVGQLVTHPLFLLVTIVSILFILAKQTFETRQKASRLQHEKELARRQIVTQKAQKNNFVRHMMHKQE